MSRPTEYIRDLAQNLVSHETKGGKSSEDRLRAAFRVCDRIRPQLTNLLGSAGFHALLSRSLALASGSTGRSGAIRVNESGALELTEPGEPALWDQQADGALAVIVHLLGLLVAFIGEGLTIQVIQDIWPEVPLQGEDSNRGGKK